MIGRRSETTKSETPCFWYQFLVSGVRNLDTSFWWPETWEENLGRVPSTLLLWPSQKSAW